MSGVTVGLKNLHYAPLTKDDQAGVTYSTPIKIAGAIEAKITPQTNSSTLYADDGAAETSSAMGEVLVEINIKSLPTDVQKALLGHTLNSDGVLIKKSDDVAPYVAIGFQSANSDGSIKYVWLYKGKFELPEENYKTKSENVEYQTPTTKATFVKREFDNAWQASVNSGDTGIKAGVIPGWFTAVYKEPTGA
jgi:phi13 family phage major tail protein